MQEYREKFFKLLRVHVELCNDISYVKAHTQYSTVHDLHSFSSFSFTFSHLNADETYKIICWYELNIEIHWSTEKEKERQRKKKTKIRRWEREIEDIGIKWEKTEEELKNFSYDKQK